MKPDVKATSPNERNQNLWLNYVGYAERPIVSSWKCARVDHQP